MKASPSARGCKLLVHGFAQQHSNEGRQALPPDRSASASHTAHHVEELPLPRLGIDRWRGSLGVRDPEEIEHKR